MVDVLYFAYGSNMLRERLLARCQNARIAGIATLPDHRLTFDKFSTKDFSGKCAYELAEGEQLAGVLWDLSETDLPKLDRVEGVGHGYERITADVLRAGAETIAAVTYRATDRRPDLRPFDWYLDLVVAGAMQQGLPKGYIEGLRATPFEVDKRLNRPERVEALDMLEEAGRVGVKR